MLYGTKNISRVGTKFADLPRAYLVASVRVPYARAARAFFTSRVYLHSWIPVKDARVFAMEEVLGLIFTSNDAAIIEKK